MREQHREARLQVVLQALARCGGNGIPTSEVTAELGNIWDRNTVTNYLRELEGQGVVTQGAIRSQWSHKTPGFRQGWFIEGGAIKKGVS